MRTMLKGKAKTVKAKMSKALLCLLQPSGSRGGSGGES